VRGGLGPFIGGGRLAEGARVRAYLNRRASGGAVRREESAPSLVKVLTGGAGVSASGREGSIPVRGPGDVGLRACSEAGTNMTPAAFLLFFNYFSLFFCFLIYSISFA
jgi:hypothetical protein